MEPIEIIERKGYRALKLEDDLWIARGSGLSGEILFIPGRKTPCDFLKSTPKDKGYLCDLDEKTTVFQWHDEDGTIHSCKKKKCCLGELRSAHADCSITAHFSKISTGSRSIGHFRSHDDDGNISLITLYLALYTSPEKPEYLREELLNAINKHPHSNLYFRDTWDKDSDLRISAYDHFLLIAEPIFLKWIRFGSSATLKEVANLLEKIDRKTRKLEKSETDFLSAVSEAATNLFEVPTQKDVREIWISMQAGRNEKQFRDVRNRLGFEWLPAAKRGKNSH